ncbi:EXOSX-like protein [Mya arenaria]|uniref:EXOSX-like protein n=1 Tax=Mya arenaria TaxID=6604 RepID=A0ABY7EYG5_MYAAR|nr:EXOSX-like protein [Mya arenaria]
MADEACGSEEKAKFLSEYEDVNQFMQQTLRSVLLATKSSNEMPAAGDDFDYYSSFPGFQGLMNIEGKRILHVIQSILKHENVRANLGSMGGAADIEDKLDQLMDANDQILERVSPGSSSAAPNFRLLSAKNIQRPQLRKPKVARGSHTRDVRTAGVQDNQTSPCKAQEPGDIDETPCMFINTPEQLGPLVTMLKKQSEIAIDLEHHNYRTFQGMTCLMQISTRSHDYLIDTLELRSDLQFLNEVFTDPSIVKVLHGADSDIDWLQRDLGLYIVNMFDTGQAARVMNYSRFSLAHLLQQYCGVTADKQYQLADWRIRGNNSNNLLLSVLNRSRHLCMKVYQKQIHTPDNPGLMTRQSALFSSGKTNMIIEVKDEPLLTAFNKNYLPDKTGGKTVPRKSQMSKEEQSGSPWKLLPCSIKRKKESSDSPANSVLPTKRSRTDLQAEAMPTNKHLRFTDEGETIEITDDDKKALPQDLKIPIRFQVPSKKKKKNRNKDIDLIESVQEHLTNIRKIQEENETVLGKRPGDDQPSASEKTKKVKQKMKDSKKKKGQGKNGNKNSESSAMDTATDLVVIDSDEETVGEKAGGAKSAKGGLKTEVTIEIDDSDSNDAEVKVVEEFKPYDYTEGAKQLLKDTKQRGKGHDYYNPQSSGRGKSKNMRNRSQKKGIKEMYQTNMKNNLHLK